MKTTCGLLFISLVLFNARSRAQQIKITDARQLLTERLKPATRTFQVYLTIGENAQPSRFQTWKRTVKDTSYQQQPAVIFTHQVLISDTVIDWARTICQRQTLANLYHKTWNRQRDREIFNFAKGTLFMNNQLVTAADTAQRNKQAFEGFAKARSMYSLNWHADLELFPLLPFNDSAVLIVPFYHPGGSGPVQADYRVTGSAVYKDANDLETDC